MISTDSSVRVSIVVPHLGDDRSFEETLISVLENRPSRADIWVAHDGTYRDPFDLGDEVRFLTGRSAKLPVLIAASAEVVPGDVIHVLAGGLRATDGWTDDAVARFEQLDVAVVAPVVRSVQTGLIMAAGWTESTARLIRRLGCGKPSLSKRDFESVGGAYLPCSFWRKSELRAAARAMVTEDTIAAEFAWNRLLFSVGWRCSLAADSHVIADEDCLDRLPSVSRGHTLGSLIAEIDDRAMYGSVALSVLLNLFAPSRWGEVLGQAISLIRPASCIHSLRYDQVHTPSDEAETIRMPSEFSSVSALQRAA